MKTLLLIPLIFILSFIGCDSGTTETTSPPVVSDKPTTEIPTPTVEITEPDNRIPLALNGLYATSTDPSSNVQFVFDRDETSIWKTRSGAGPDEGIMLYFAEPTMIKSIKVEQADESELASIESYTVYGNGSPLDLASPGQDVSINQELANIYLRFSTDENIKVTSSPIESDFYDKIQLERFEQNKKIGIKNIIVEGENGEFKIIAPAMMKGAVNASSTLKEESFAYDASLLFDARKEFVWVEGEKGDGIGTKLVFTFEEEVTISGLQLWNGYQRSESHYKSNAKLKGFGFGTSGSALESYQLKDEQGVQSVKLKTPVSGKSFELEIQSSYKGWSYKDLAISEILFFDEADALFGIRSERTNDNRNAIKQKTKGTVLESLVDSRIFNLYTSEEYPMAMTRSAILRSDGTFVLYSSEEDESDSVETIADGNWEIIKADSESATISVFGKLLDFSLLEMYYAGKEDAELSRIFRDKITIKDNTIQGEKLINAIKF